MMPNFPELERDFMNFLAEFMQTRMRHHLGPMDRIKRVTHFEGDGTVAVRRDDGSERTSGMERFSEPFEIKTDDLRRFNPAQLTALLDALMRKMAGHMARHTYEVIGTAAEQAGQVVDVKGQKLTAEHLFEMLEKIDIEFAPSGQPIMPELHMTPDMAEAAVRLGRELEEDERQRSRHAALMVRKKEEWRAREARRTLVG